VTIPTSVRPHSGHVHRRGTIFGVTGGVMEAALRTRTSISPARTLPRSSSRYARADRVKEGSIECRQTIRIAVPRTGHVEQVIDKIREPSRRRGDAVYFVEVMACPADALAEAASLRGHQRMRTGGRWTLP